MANTNANTNTGTGTNAKTTGARVAFLVSLEGIEEAALVEPWNAARDAGGRPTLLAPHAGEVQCFRHLDRASRRPVDATVADARVDDYDALVLPGGVANADQLRTDPQAVHFVRRMFESDKPAAVICHGPWILADAGVLDGRTLTSWPSLRTDLHNAGAEWVDEEVRVDGRMVSSRNPHDLPAFCRALVAVFASTGARAARATRSQ